jgi:ubiquinone/menaquinone biosynthesis C-methylase UbiE
MATRDRNFLGESMNDHESGQVTRSAAEVYEAFFVPALFGAWPDRVLRAAGTRPGNAVLDVATGTGILARKAAELVGPKSEVAGVDINEGMLAVARQKAPHIDWNLAAAESLPFDDAHFDQVASQFGLMFFRDPVQAIREMARVLRPGGRLAVAVWDSLEATPGYAQLARLLGEFFGPEAAHALQAPYALGDKEKLASLFAQAGLPEPAIETIAGTARFPSLASWMYTDIKGWTLSGMIDDDGFEQLQHVAQERLAPFVQADGSVAFAAPAHIVTVSRR